MCPSGGRHIGIGPDRHPTKDPSIPVRHTLIAGATATGKSDLALRWARETGGVVVNADSQQLYAGLRVLTARPSAEDEALVPHRLYGIVDPADAWSVGRWLSAVQALIETEDRPLILVGGTGLYFRALLKGLAPVPEIDTGIRNLIEAEYEAVGEATFRRHLAHDDPAAEARIAPGDRQRLIRARAVAMSTGRSLTSWQSEVSRPLIAPEACDRLVVERDRDALYQRCDRRVDVMLAGGAIAEVEALLARRLPADLPAMLAVGVREIAAALSGEIDLEQATERLKTRTRQYAKRQLTWFRNQTSDWPRTKIAEL